MNIPCMNVIRDAEKVHLGSVNVNGVDIHWVTGLKLISEGNGMYEVTLTFCAKYEEQEESK